MNGRHGAALLLGAAAALLAATGVSAGAATVTGPVRGDALAAVATRVRVRLVQADVTPGSTAEVVATVLPRMRGRAVTLKRFNGTRFIGVVTALTNGHGVADLRASFRRTGDLRLRAFVAPGPGLAAVVSPPVVETVTKELPLAFSSTLSEGATGPDVLALQERLSALGYWLGTPDGDFSDTTEEAVYALQKSAGLHPSGVVDAPTLAALNAKVLPTPRSASGYVIEINLDKDLLMVVNGGHVTTVLNTSTGGYTYTEDGETDVADTPTGVFHIFSATDGLVVDSLGELWRPRFFDAGFAIHGDTYVPPYPVSHGCARVTNEAIDWIWSANVAPIGTEVWVY